MPAAVKNDAQSSPQSSERVPDVTRVGNLVADPELRFTPSGDAVANFDLAVTPYNFDTKQTEETVYYTVSVWRDMAEHVVESLHKGDRVIVVGKPSLRQWEGRDGEMHTNKEITAYNIGPDLRFAEATVRKTTARGVNKQENTAPIPADF